tara:strand:- start:89 stop:442 length:354 start_codon:yes stop_codon:yes gene_type:complete
LTRIPHRDVLAVDRDGPAEAVSIAKSVRGERGGEGPTTVHRPGARARPHVRLARLLVRGLNASIVNDFDLVHWGAYYDRVAVDGDGFEVIGHVVWVLVQGEARKGSLQTRPEFPPRV